MRKNASPAIGMALITCLALLSACAAPASPASPTPAQAPSAETSSQPAPFSWTPASPAPTQISTASPVPQLPARQEIAQRFAAEIQPLVLKLRAAQPDPAATINPDDQVIPVPLTERLYAVQTVLGLDRPADPARGRHVYVLYEVLRGADLSWGNQAGFNSPGLADTQAVVSTLRLVLESGGNFALVERLDGSAGEGKTSFEQLVTDAVPPLQGLPPALQLQVESDLETIIAYACGIDLRPGMDLTRRATALALTLESSDWADKRQGLHSLRNLPNLPDSLVPTLLAHVSDDRFSFEVSELLSQMGAGGGVFEQALRDATSPDAQVRQEAARLLGDTPGDPARAIPALIKLARDEDVTISQFAMDSLTDLGPAAVEALIEMLKDPDTELARQAAYALGRIADVRAIPALVGAMQAGNADLTDSAASALGQMGAPGVEPLIGLLKNADSQVRESAARALGMNAQVARENGMSVDLRAVEPLIAALRDATPEVRHNAAGSLGNLADPRAVLPITALLKDPDQWVREQAIHVLGDFKDPRAVGPLIGAFSDSEWRVRSYASQALVSMGAQAVQPLGQALADPNADVRFWAAQSLDEIDDRAADEPLLARLRLGDAEVAAGAYRFFIERGEPGSEAVLTRALEKHGNEQMATDFLNCGNSLLEQAARDWAKKNGYTIRGGQKTGQNPIWGAKR